MSHDEDIAHEILSAALDKDLKADFPNARLGLRGPTNVGPPTPNVIRGRLDGSISELEALVGDLQTLIATLATIRDKL